MIRAGSADGGGRIPPVGSRRRRGALKIGAALDSRFSILDSRFSILDASKRWGRRSTPAKGFLSSFPGASREAFAGAARSFGSAPEPATLKDYVCEGEELTDPLDPASGETRVIGAVAASGKKFL